VKGSSNNLCNDILWGLARLSITGELASWTIAFSSNSGDSYVYILKCIC